MGSETRVLTGGAEVSGRPLTPPGSRRGRRTLGALALVGVLPLPVLAYVLGAHVIAQGSAPGRGPQLLTGPALLLGSALVIAGVGGFLIWTTMRSLARAHEVEHHLESLNGTLVARLEESTPVMSSFTRMLSTIEKQTDEISIFAQRLDSAHRELESANARLQEISLTDELTHLSNRRAFSLRLEEEVARFERLGHHFSLVLLDVDGFKAINDNFGHLAGDGILRSLADLLLKNSRAIDIVCRFGGDEFAIVLVETGPPGGGLYAERIRDLVGDHSFADGHQITASLGIASVPEDARTAQDVLRLADEALCAAKRAGKNRVVMGGDLAVGVESAGYRALA